MMKTTFTTAALSLCFAAGCSFAARSPDMYREDVHKLLDGQAASIKSCYDGALQGDKAAGGTVTVRFVVEKDTGAFKDASVDAARTTAPEAVQKCVVDSLQGLTLKPGDAQQGDATFSWEFKANPAKEIQEPSKS